MPTLSQLIAERARVRGLDPNAVLAVAAGEGLSGGIGDQGRSYGPFQLFTQGAFPKTKLGLAPAQRQAWAMSPAGIDYALGQMSFARGLKGERAAEAIIRRFERPRDPNKSVAAAQARLRSGNFGAPQAAAGAPAPAPAAPPSQPAATGFDPLLANVYASNAQILGVPALDPSLLTEPPARAQVARLETGQGSLTVEKDFGGRTTPRINKVLKLAQEYLGTPYAWGGGGPAGPSKGFGRGANTVGFDCSSFVQYLWAKQGVKVPRTTYEQFKVGAPVKKIGQLRPGDSVFFHAGEQGPEHMGLYIGNGQFIHAPHTGDVVKVSKITDPYYRSNFMGGRRNA